MGEKKELNEEKLKKFNKVGIKILIVLIALIVLLGGYWEYLNIKEKKFIKNANSEQYLIAQVNKALGSRTNMKKERFMGLNVDNPKRPQIHMMGDENITDKLTIYGYETDLLDYFSAISKDERIDKFDAISVAILVDTVDARGNKSLSPGLVIDMPVKEIKSIKWENFIVDNFPKVATRFKIDTNLFDLN